LLADVASMMRPRAEQRGNTLRVEYTTEMPETIFSDPARLRQTLVNLTGNAVKFTENGCVRLRAAFLPQWRDNQPGVRIEVVDTGIGIREDALARLFQPFTQADSKVSTRYGGTGLGLAISRQIVEMLGGELSVTSEFGHGSTFTLAVPTGDLSHVKMLQRPAEASVESAPRRERTIGKNLLGVRVLLAEDGFDNQRLISTVLRRAGAEVKIAENGRIAVAMAEAEPFDVLLMDMNMPEMDGDEATRLLRSRDYRRPILALTAATMAEDISRSLAAGCDDHLAKPIDLAALIETVEWYAKRDLTDQTSSTSCEEVSAEVKM
jgi:ammonium transporter, Amt family